jgi:hypothetical protein
MTLAIGHYDFRQQSVVLDCVRESKPPFSPEAVVQEFSQTLKNYRVSELRGDRYCKCSIMSRSPSRVGAV